MEGTFHFALLRAHQELLVISSFADEGLVLPQPEHPHQLLAVGGAVQ